MIKVPGTLKKLAGALFPMRGPGFQYCSEVPGEVQKATSIHFEDTEPLEREVLLGPPLNSEEGLGRIMSVCNQLILGHIKGMAASETFQLGEGRMVDITIRKPYRLRIYKGGCMVKIHD